jgi:hypothetical protein
VSPVAGRITVLSPEGKGASYAKVSIAMLRADHPVPRERREGGRRLFLESSLSVPPPSSNESEATPPGGSKAGPGRASRRSGRSASQPGRPRAELNRPSTPRPFWQPANWYACTSCIGTSSPSPTAPRP